MKQESPPNHMDVKAFAQSGNEIAGVDSLFNYERLMLESKGLGADRMLNWSVRGEFPSDEAGSAQIWLHLGVTVSLPMICQRCLGPVDIDVAVNRSFRFVEGEDAAEAQDEEAEEDVLALSRDFNLAELIEDEVLMDLPVVPTHEECPVHVKLSVADSGFDAAIIEKRNPFGVLASLQPKKSS
jgi:uncharacterized protein